MARDQAIGSRRADRRGRENAAGVAVDRRQRRQRRRRRAVRRPEHRREEFPVAEPEGWGEGRPNATSGNGPSSGDQGARRHIRFRVALKSDVSLNASSGCRLPLVVAPEEDER